MENETKELLRNAPLNKTQKEIITKLINEMTKSMYSSKDLKMIEKSITLEKKEIDNICLVGNSANLIIANLIIEKEISLINKLKS